ncbi:MAG: NAD-dependent epimerase/dehydratase family protein [Anaerolineae bacterium]
MVSGVPERIDWAEKRVLVTGATGFIGQHLVQRLVEAGARVYAGGAPDEEPERIARLPVQAQRLAFDLRDAGAVQVAVAKITPWVVFHLAAVGVTGPSVDPLAALAVNTGGTVHLLEALREREVGRIVLVGTCYEYGAREAMEGLDPFNAYAASKVAAWAFGRMYWRAHGLPVITTRPFQIYGPGQPDHALVPAAICAALAGEDFPMTLGEQERDFVYVDDVVEGLLGAAEAQGIEGYSLDLGTGRVHTIRQVVERIWAMTEARGRILPGALPYRPGEVMHLAADAGRTARLIGWRARVGLEEGLRRTIEMKVTGV